MWDILLAHRLKKKPNSPIHGVRLHISEPHSEVGGEVLSCQLQHCHFASTIQLNTDTQNGLFFFYLVKKVCKGQLSWVEKELAFQKKWLCTYLQTFHRGDRCDWCVDRAHSLIKGILCFVSANDSPGSPIIDYLLFGLFGACGSLKKEKSTTKKYTFHFLTNREKKQTQMLNQPPKSQVAACWRQGQRLDSLLSLWKAD